MIEPWDRQGLEGWAVVCSALREVLPLKLSVVIPAYNEEATVETILRRVRPREGDLLGFHRYRVCPGERER